MRRRRPRLLSDNGPCYVSGSLQEYLEQRGPGHGRERPYHPMAQGKTQQQHCTWKNMLLLLNNYCSRDDFRAEIAAFVHYL